jgi:dTDP-4-dehydrorhamnose reductase
LGVDVHIAIIGAKGMLGSELVRVLGAKHSVTAWDIDEIDITDREASIRKLTELGPELVINAAAFVNVDSCDKEPDTAWKVNTVGAQNLALAAERAGAALVYISTDYVFDGESDSDYTEAAAPNPINHYGASKLAGEYMTRQLCPRSYILRTAWLFGHSPRNYVERVLNAAREQGVVRMSEDQIEAPTYTRHLAEAIERLIETGAYGTYNVTAESACTRVAFAKEVLRQVGDNTPVEVVAAHELSRTAPRPRRTVLDMRLLRLVTGSAPPDWKQGVADYLADKGG